jgi:malate dehydrogenase (oxaloacetate-decarboxylating)
VKKSIAEVTADQTGRRGGLADAMAGADVYIGVSGGTVPEEVVATMAPAAIIFAMANPNPEIHPDVAHRYARVVATGRSDFPNQINNVLAFPGIFRGAFDARATAITEPMKMAAARALADLVGVDLADDHIIPAPFDPRVGAAVAAAVAAASPSQQRKFRGIDGFAAAMRSLGRAGAPSSMSTLDGRLRATCLMANAQRKGLALAGRATLEDVPHS